jgi:hypothetical protein
MTTASLLGMTTASLLGMTTASRVTALCVVGSFQPDSPITSVIRERKLERLLGLAHPWPS